MRPPMSRIEIGVLETRQQLGIGPDPEVAGVAGVQRIEQRQAPVAGGDRQREAFGEAADGRAGVRRPAGAAEHRQGALRLRQQRCELLHLACARPGLHRLESRRIRDRGPLGQHVLRQADHHRAGPAAGGGVEGARDDFRHACRIVDLGGPFRHAAEHRAQVELLQGFAILDVAGDLADEHDHRGRILLGDMDAGRGIGGARPARDEADAGPSGRLADRFRHHGGAAFLPADRDRELAVVKGVEDGQIAFARHAEDMGDAVDHQLIHQRFGGGAGLVERAHGRGPSNFAGQFSEISRPHACARQIRAGQNRR